MSRILEWLCARTYLIITFILLFFIGDAVTTAIGVEIGLGEGNPMMATAISDSWGMYMLFKVLSTLVILSCFYLMFARSKRLTALRSDREARVSIVESIDLDRNNVEFFTWGVFLTISILIVVSNLSLILRNLHLIIT